ncbi:uncharacterized protein BKCO1_6800019 [Diplodia corticola]|uniref:Clr5 domain-containing protein n=1 Tax=Diplodia corticola TaxID=236234 RepID=A0A1J9QNH7_9PEZI|nr:uncharacterized protein BKCO1_6800019 [Diplodia corticola]OJD30009.1 hypothetical protein BKCO1_6800019 [Diplodia corticola]
MDPNRPPGHSAGPAGPLARPSSSSVQERWESLKHVIEHQYINEKRKLLDLAEYMKNRPPGHSAGPAGPLARPSSSSVQERWESLKHVIEHQYINEKRKLLDLAEYMKVNYGFDAGVNQYKYQFKKWGSKKNVPSAAKNHIGRCLNNRAEAGRTSTEIQYKGHTVAPEKMRRYLKDKRRKEAILKGPTAALGVVASAKLAFGRNIFVGWNMPYGAFRLSGSNRLPPSPYATAPSPYGDVVVVTPPSDAESPGAQAVQRRMNADTLNAVAIERAQLFIQGKHAELLERMTKQDFRVMNEWLYQFWLFSFKSAKHWGHGPRHWTAAGLRFSDFEAIRTSNHSTPRFVSSTHGTSPRAVMSPSTNESLQHPGPSQLCNWAIHVRGASRDFRPPTTASACEQDPQDEDSWQPWSPSFQEQPFDEQMRDALEHNDFSTIKSHALPVAIPLVAKETIRSPSEMLLEALSFAIMSRNVDLVHDLIDKALDQDIDIGSCHPFHLAATYLEGSQACCTVFRNVMEFFDEVYLDIIPLDDLGHTIIDKLMLVILKSHSTALPSIVDPTNHERRFPGDEIDICGRWDADSDCYRSLLSRGIPAVPREWKHKFCHTSAQSICEIIDLVAEQIDNSSGLYSRLCTSCGLNLTMSHLHALVVTAFHLAEHGVEDEDLFGILACVLRMLANGVDPRLKPAISMELLGIHPSGDMDTCTHEDLTPYQLAQCLGSYSIFWPEKLVTGWGILCWILGRSEKLWCLDENEVYDDGCEHEDYFRNDATLATLWASVQTELLTYRRVHVNDSWVSANFDLERLLWGLTEEEKVSVGLVEKGLMKPHCQCGFFIRDPPCMTDVSATYFSNMDIWGRATYLPL